MWNTVGKPHESLICQTDELWFSIYSPIISRHEELEISDEKLPSYSFKCITHQVDVRMRMNAISPASRTS